jgi:NAD(P)-dependent dehydrogenase (short-subunit alcohol dehydrogenase family)
MSTFLVTGANRGIGLAFSRLLQARGERVVAVCRAPSAELEALAAQGLRMEAGLDLAEEGAPAELVHRLDSLPLDGVILNAGILEVSGLEDLDPGDVRRQFEVNAVAPLRLARALIASMPEGAKLALITSRMGSIADNGSGGYYGYRMSKAALNMAGRSLAIDLRPRGIAVAILHPGLVSTRMVGFTPQGISPEHAAQGMLERIDALSLKSSGSFWHANGEMLPW